MMNPFRAVKWVPVLFLLLWIVNPQPALGAVRCETQYGGNQVCVSTGQLQVNKEIFDPQNNKFVDNLGLNDHRFAPGELVDFRISVKNVGDATFDKVSVADTPPADFLELATGALNFDLTSLNPGETQQRELKMRVIDSNRLPQNNVICIINAAEASSGNEKDRDTSQLCLERKVLAVETKELPKTGPESGFLTLFGSISGLTMGWKLLKFRKIHPAGRSYYQLTEDRLNMKGGE